MPNRLITNINVRSKAALTTSFVMATESIYSDAGNTPDTNQDLTTTGGNADIEWIGRKFKSPSAATMYVSTISLTLGGTGTPAGTLAAYIFTDDGAVTSVPSVQLSGSEPSDLVTASDISTAAGGETVTFRWTRGCPVLAPSTQYWVVIQSTGYTYSDGVTEIRWRTDANGAVGLNECAKYDANAGTPWTTMGADVGADLVLNEALIISTGDKNQVSLHADFTLGSSDGARVKVEFSADRIDWVQQNQQSLAGGVMSFLAYENQIIDEKGTPINFPVSQPYMRISSRALTLATNAELGLVALLSFI